jgi:hypothetical protein
VSGPDGGTLAVTKIASRTTVHVPLRALEDGGLLTLLAQGGGRAITGDSRTLNFRAFAPERRYRLGVEARNSALTAASSTART